MVGRVSEVGSMLQPGGCPDGGGPRLARKAVAANQRSDFSAPDDCQGISHAIVTMGQGMPQTETKPVVAL
jgi:hypothetical protein